MRQYAATAKALTQINTDNCTDCSGEPGSSVSVPEHILYMVNSTPAMSRGHGMRWLPLTKVTQHVASWEGVTSERSVVIRVHPWGGFLRFALSAFIRDQGPRRWGKGWNSIAQALHGAGRRGANDLMEIPEVPPRTRGCPPGGKGDPTTGRARGPSRAQKDRWKRTEERHSSSCHEEVGRSRGACIFS